MHMAETAPVRGSKMGGRNLTNLYIQVLDIFNHQPAVQRKHQTVRFPFETSSLHLVW